MPSLQQMNVSKPVENTNGSRYGNIKKYSKIILGAIVLWLAYSYSQRAEIVNIPDEAYAKRENSLFKDLFANEYKKVFWFGADCPISRQRKRIVDAILNKTQLDKYFVHRPFLQNSIRIVAISDPLGDFIMKNCANDYCIVVPPKRLIIHTKDKHLLRDLNKYKNM